MSNVMHTCTVCKTIVCGDANWQAHLNGAAHQRRVRGEEGGQFHCDLCNVDISGTKAMNEHVAGKSHLNRLARAHNGGSVPADVDLRKPVREVNLFNINATPDGTESVRTTCGLSTTTGATSTAPLKVQVRPTQDPAATLEPPTDTPAVPPFNPDSLLLSGASSVANSTRPSIGSSAMKQRSRKRTAFADQLRAIADSYERGEARHVKVVVDNRKSALSGVVVETLEDSETDGDDEPVTVNAGRPTSGVGVVGQSWSQW